MAKRKCSAAQKAVVLLLAALMAITMGSSSLVFATGEEAVKSAPEIQKGDTAVKMTGRPNASTGKADVSFTLTGADEDWMQAVTEVDLDGTVVEKREAETGRPVEDSNLKADINEYGIVKTGEGKAAAYTLVIDSRLFESVRSAKHQVVVKATGYEDAVKEVTVTSFGAHKLFVRHLDKDGRVVDTKTFTIDEIEKLEAFKQDVLQQGICSHHGIRGFRANGVALNDLFKAAGNTIGARPANRVKAGMADQVPAEQQPCLHVVIFNISCDLITIQSLISFYGDQKTKPRRFAVFSRFRKDQFIGYTF